MKREHERDLRIFLSNGSFGNQWFRIGDMDIYLRRTIRVIGPTKLRTIDIGSVGIEDEDRRGRGQFTKLLATLECLAQELGYRIIYVENVFFPETFGKYLIRKGFQADERYGVLGCYYRKVPVESYAAFKWTDRWDILIVATVLIGIGIASRYFEIVGGLVAKLLGW